jgi:cysteinyl-tRNA synthetase
MKLYNTLTRQKEEFIPKDPNNVRIYACGPTVYNYFHIGNARCFVVFDMLRRYLEYRGYNVTFVQNFTDVDDKMIKRANEEGTTVAQIAERYIAEYYKDANGLGIRPATIHPRATENIDEIIKIVSSLIEKGHAYEKEGDVYFRTLSFKDYGKLSNMPIEELEKGARIDISEQKEDALDFALWKAAKPGEPSWESPWGKGRPGWHIECSAMAIRYLGETIDIHCGGQDLTFPHHENEVAQSECCTGKPFANFWLHNGYINVNNTKMSKSLGNFFTVRDVAEKYGYQAIRFFILSAQYRSPINFSAEIIEQSKNALERIQNCVGNLKFFIKTSTNADELSSEAKALVDKHKSDFIEAMDDDLNTADAIAAIFELVRDANELVAKNAPKSDAEYSLAAITELCELLGIETGNAGSDSEFEAEILAAIERRAAAKKAKDYATADKIRAELQMKGVILEDTPKGTKFRIEK